MELEAQEPEVESTDERQRAMGTAQQYDEDFEDDEEIPLVYHLTLHVIQARGLPIADEFSSDPYLTVSVGGQKRRTRAVQASTDPRWEEILQFELDAKICASGMLSLRMMDENFLKSDIRLCSAELPVYSLRGGPWWCELSQSGERRGMLQLRFEWSPSPPPVPPGGKPFLMRPTPPSQTGAASPGKKSAPQPPAPTAAAPAAALPAAATAASWGAYALALDAWQKQRPRAPTAVAPGSASAAAQHPPPPHPWAAAAAHAPPPPYAPPPYGGPPYVPMPWGAPWAVPPPGWAPADAAGPHCAPARENSTGPAVGAHSAAAAARGPAWSQRRGGRDEAQPSAGLYAGLLPRGKPTGVSSGPSPWLSKEVSKDGGTNSGSSSWQKSANRAAALRAFCMYDYDRSGTLSVDEYIALIRHLERAQQQSGSRPPASDAEIRREFEALDENGDGRLDLQEWLDRADDQYDYDESQRALAAAKEARLRDTAWLRAEARPALEKRATSDALSPARSPLEPKPACDRSRSDGATRLRCASR